MGVRFYRSIRLLPFLYLNFSKTGISFSLGRPGAALNVSPKGARGSVGLPGTGLSYRKTLPGIPGTGLSWRTIFAGGGAWGLIRWVLLVAALIAAAGCAFFFLQNQ